MQFRRLLILIPVVCMLVLPVLAQEDSDAIWHLRIDTLDAGGNLTLYTLAGDEQLMLHSTESVPFFVGYRVSDDTFVGRIDTGDDDTLLYRLNPDGAEVFDVASALEDTDFESSDLRIPVAFAYPYLVLADARLRDFRPYAILDIDTVEVSLLEYPSLGFYERLCCRFSADGSILRYGSEEANPDDDGISTYRIVEQDMVTGESTVIHEFTGRSGYPISPDTEGTRWLRRINDKNEDGDLIVTHTILNLDGTTEELVSGVIREVDDFRFAGDALYHYYPLCEMLCTLEMTFPDGDVISYRTNPQQIFTSFWFLEDDHVLARDSSDIYVLSPDSAPQFIIELDPSRIFLDQVVADGSVISSTLGDGRIAIYDVNTGIITHTLEAERAVNAISMPYGYALWDLKETSVVYLPDSGRVIELNTATGVGDILPDGRIIYTQRRVDEDEKNHLDLFVYDPANNSQTLISEDSRPLYTPDLRFSSR